MSKSIQHFNLNKEEFNFPNSKENLIGFVKLNPKNVEKIMNIKTKDRRGKGKQVCFFIYRVQLHYCLHRQ